MKIAVIGAGPAGMTAAYKLQKYGHEVTLYEAAAEVGGLSRTIELWGQKVDLGPHRFFSNDRRINEAWLEVVQRDYSMVDRLTRIYYKKRFFHYPLKALNALQNLGIFEAILCVLSYCISAAANLFRTAAPSTFEDWVTSRFGRRLFEIFFKTYSEKLWGISCKDLDADFAAQRIKKLSLFAAVWNALVGGRGNKHKTLVDQFAYPHGGTGAVYERMANMFVAEGGTLKLSTPIKRVRKTGNQVTGVELQNGGVESYDHVVSTMPLTLMVKSLDDCPAPVTDACNALKYRNTILVYLEIAAQNIFPDNWIYVHSADMQCGRITNFRNWTPDLYGTKETTIVCMEFWANMDEPLWLLSDEQLGELARKEMRSTGLIGNAPILNHHIHRIARSYPVYSTGYKVPLEVVVNYLKRIEGLTVIGRYGAFKYNNQDHSILMGLLAAENIGRGAKHDLWAVNTDDEYQEEAKISATGIVLATS